MKDMAMLPMRRCGNRHSAISCEWCIADDLHKEALALASKDCAACDGKGTRYYLVAEDEVSAESCDCVQNVPMWPAFLKDVPS